MSVERAGSAAPALLRIGAFAQLVGVSIRTVRYYEELGLLEPTLVTDGGSRMYDEAAVGRLSRIIQLKELMNFSLEEVRVAVEFDDQLTALKELAEPDRVSGAYSQKLIDTATTYIEVLNERRAALLDKRARIDDLIAEVDDKLRRTKRRRAEYARRSRS
jgi:DNA-binding transcriptional MerR regulator